MPHSRSGSWIRPVKRLAIYLRDSWRCAYCGRDVRDRDCPTPTLEHVERWPTRARGDGFNEPGNLVLACAVCNAHRGTLPIVVYLASLPPGVARASIRRIGRRLSTGIGPYMVEAKALQADPPSWLLDLRLATRDRYRAGPVGPELPVYGLAARELDRGHS